jgi:quercetin dioxygenase-like cupin family protein
MVTGHGASVSHPQKVAKKEAGEHGRALALARMILATGQSGEQHRHPNADEVIYLFRSNVAVSVGNETFLLQPADALTIPAGLTHRIENNSNEEAEMILAILSASENMSANNCSPLTLKIRQQKLIHINN